MSCSLPLILDDLGSLPFLKIKCLFGLDDVVEALGSSHLGAHEVIMCKGQLIDILVRSLNSAVLATYTFKFFISDLR